MYTTWSRLLPCAIVVMVFAALLVPGRPLQAHSASAATPSRSTSAQVSVGPRLIAYLGNGPSDSERACMAEMRSALEAAGWSIDNQLTIEWNDAGHDPSRLAPMAQALVARKPDLLLTAEVAPAEALMKATQSLPIVVLGASNLRRVVDEHARPLANVTGVTLSLRGQHAIKPMELLLQAFPQARRIGMIENHGNPLHRGAGLLGPIPDMVRQAGAELHRVHFSGEAGIAGAWEELARLKVDAVMIRPDSPPLLAEHARQALRLRIPAISHHSWFSERYGGLLSYGVIGRINLCGRGARYVDRVLRGSLVSELPAEELYEAGLSINLETAERLGVRLPAALIARAERLNKTGAGQPTEQVGAGSAP